MKSDFYNCRYDLAMEQIDEAERRAHDDGRCPGAPACEWCLDEQEKNIVPSD